MEISKVVIFLSVAQPCISMEFKNCFWKVWGLAKISQTQKIVQLKRDSLYESPIQLLSACYSRDLPIAILHDDSPVFCTPVYKTTGIYLHNKLKAEGTIWVKSLPPSIRTTRRNELTLFSLISVWRWSTQKFSFGSTAAYFLHTSTCIYNCNTHLLMQECDHTNNQQHWIMHNRT